MARRVRRFHTQSHSSLEHPVAYPITNAGGLAANAASSPTTVLSAWTLQLVSTVVVPPSDGSTVRIALSTVTNTLRGSVRPPSRVCAGVSFVGNLGRHDINNMLR